MDTPTLYYVFELLAMAQSEFIRFVHDDEQIFKSLNHIYNKVFLFVTLFEKQFGTFSFKILWHIENKLLKKKIYRLYFAKLYQNPNNYIL